MGRANSFDGALPRPASDNFVVNPLAAAPADDARALTPGPTARFVVNAECATVPFSSL